MSNHNKNSVSREKYDSMKNKGTKWYDDCVELKDKVEKFYQMNKTLVEQNEDLLDQIKDLQDSHMNETNNDGMDELETENKTLRKDIRNLKRDSKLLEEKYRDKVVQLERDLFVKDGKIQRLEDARKDLNERYMELKEDWREERRTNKKEK
jgi:predicted  nucleic acid-binding Zn-ribbon protein